MERPFRSHPCRNVDVIKAAIVKGLLRLRVYHVTVTAKHERVERQLYVVQNGVPSEVIPTGTSTGTLPVGKKKFLTGALGFVSLPHP